MGGPRVAIVQPAIPDYRLPLFQGLARAYGDDIRFYAGDSYGSGTTKTVRDAEAALPGFRRLKNDFLLGERFLWQRGYEDELQSAGLVIANGSLRTLSTLHLLWKRAGRRPTVLWGHIHGRLGGATRFRNRMLRAADAFVAYTDADAVATRRLRGDDRVWSARNSCVWRSDCQPALSTDAAPRNVLYVGRLIAAKKPGLLLKAFSLAVRRGAVPATSNLVFVGDGPLKGALQDECQAHGLMERVRFEGHVSDARRLREFYAGALVATSPGYLGLSAIQAFAAGVPMLVARDEPHSPEIEACREHFNTLFVASDSVEAWASAFESAFQRADELVRRRGEISADIADRYTYERMLETFHAVVRQFHGRDPALA